jgi:integrase
MMSADKAPRSVNYAIAVVRQVFNSAKRNIFFHGISPVAGVRQLKFDNKRYRYLKHHEADKLMAVLQSRNQQLYEMAMLSLHCGLRADEIFPLIWGDINIEDGTILVRDTKNSKNRFAYMTKEIKNILNNREKGMKGELLFPNECGQKYKEIPKLCREVIAELGFNDGETDRRGKVVFHTLRHTFASWLVQNGTDLYTVQKLLGHSTIAVTERYSHLAKDNFNNAVQNFEDSLEQTEDKEMPKIVELEKNL